MVDAGLIVLVVVHLAVPRRAAHGARAGRAEASSSRSSSTRRSRWPRSATSKGLYKKARARRAQELHRHRLALRAAGEPGDPHRHDARDGRGVGDRDRRAAAQGGHARRCGLRRTDVPDRRTQAPQRLPRERRITGGVARIRLRYHSKSILAPPNGPTMTVPTSAGARLRAALAARTTAAGRRHRQCLQRAARRAGRVPRDLPFRCRRGERLVRPAGPRHHQPERRLRGRAAHHLGERPAAAGGCRHRLGRRIQHLAHDRGPDPFRRRRAATSKTRCRRSAAVTVRARRSSRPTKWSTASRPRWTAAPTSSS